MFHQPFPVPPLTRTADISNSIPSVERSSRRFDVVCSQRDVVEPDLLYVSNARGNILTRQNIQGAPDLVIEIPSEGTRARDETLKMRLYERAGVSEYWIVDPEAEIVRVDRRVGERFECAAELSREAGDTLSSSPLFPALAIPLEKVFEGTDIDTHHR